MVSYSSHVKCSGCRKLVDREHARELAKVMFGPCCYEKAKAADVWDCLGCGARLPAEFMDSAFWCKECIRRVPA